MRRRHQGVSRHHFARITRVVRHAGYKPLSLLSVVLATLWFWHDLPRRLRGRVGITDYKPTIFICFATFTGSLSPLTGWSHREPARPNNVSGVAYASGGLHHTKVFQKISCISQMQQERSTGQVVQVVMCRSSKIVRAFPARCSAMDLRIIRSVLSQSQLISCRSFAPYRKRIIKDHMVPLAHIRPFGVISPSSYALVIVIINR